MTSGIIAMLAAHDPRRYGNPVNMIMVGQMRSWLRKHFQAQSRLVIEAVYSGPLIGTKNRVCLHLVLPGAIEGEIEVAWLYALYAKRLGAERSRQQIISQLGEREGEHTRTVA